MDFPVNLTRLNKEIFWMTRTRGSKSRYFVRLRTMVTETMVVCVGLLTLPFVDYLR